MYTRVTKTFLKNLKSNWAPSFVGGSTSPSCGPLHFDFQGKKIKLVQGGKWCHLALSLPPDGVICTKTIFAFVVFLVESVN